MGRLFALPLDIGEAVLPVKRFCTASISIFLDTSHAKTLIASLHTKTSRNYWELFVNFMTLILITGQAYKRQT